MKIIAIFFLAITVAFSQNVEPTQRTFNYKDINGNDVNNGLLDGSLDYFKINNFTIGWHWGGERKISHAMLASQSDIGTGWGIVPSDYYNNNTNLFVRASWDDGYTEEINGKTIYHEFWLYTHCFYDSQIMFTKSLCYSAALAHDPTDDYKLIKLTDDPNNHIFGFKNKNQNCIVDQFTDNKWRLIVGDNIPPNTEILSNPWPNNLLSYTEDLQYPTINRDFSGRAYYVSINLRRLYDEDGFEDEDVLKIEVPYTYLDHLDVNDNKVYYTRTAKFRQIPSDQYNDRENPNGYGLRWNLTDPLEDEPQMIVKEYMLPSTTVDNGDITISGYIEFDGLVDYGGNHKLKPHNLNTEIGQIDELNLKVTYMGNCSVAINWIKFESPNTRMLLNGYYDNLIESGIQDDMTKLTTPGFTDRDIKPSRFIINVEGSPINWAAERHFKKLIGNIITGQSAAELPNHYDYYINPVDKWYSFAKFVPFVANPFNQYNHPNQLDMNNVWKTFGLLMGFNNKKWNNNSTNRFASEWETFLRYDNSKNLKELVNDLKTHNDVYSNGNKVLYEGGPISTQAYWEWNLQNNYVNKYKAGFQYSDIPWFPQTFVEGFIFPAPVNSTQNSYCPSHPNGTRVITGEEYRLMNWNPIIMGAKGLMYDGDTDNPALLDIKLNPSTKIMMTRFGLDTLKPEDWEYFLNQDNIEDIDYLSSEYSTSDFLDNTYDHFNFLNKVYNINEVASTMGVQTNRLFMGKKSVRLEMRKLHEWVRHNEETLMNLQLLSWYGKGYTVLYNQRRTFDTDSLIKKFINPSKTITKKIYGLSEFGYTNESENVDPEESFFDMTLLCNKNDTMMNNSCFIGVQNRWTDPFIYFDKDEEDMHWVHITTAEFDELTNNPNGAKNPLRPNGDTYSASDWQDYYWKRLGCREITIPFNYCDPDNPNDYVLLRVQELKADENYDESWPWWRQERFKNYIDTVIGQNSSLAVKFLPGEGKMFKVDILRPEKIDGSLAHSNQSKLISFPEYENGTPSETKIRYHMVYTKPNINHLGVQSVYYRRSRVADINTPEQQIQWESDLLVSDNVVVQLPNHNPPSTRLLLNKPAYYPSIVVRNDNNVTKAYIVYQLSAIQPEASICMFDLCSVPNEFVCKEYNNPICETILDVTNNVTLESTKPLHQTVNGDVSEYGAPVINASKYGNYYSWADEKCGIVVAYKQIGQLQITKQSILANGMYATHPSLNIYSLSDKNENDCSLVWEEKSNPAAIKSIFYTKLRMNGGSIENFLPAQISSRQNLEVYNNCLKVSDNHSSELPTVYRLLSYQGSGLERFIGFEVIAWNSTDEKNISTRAFRHTFDENQSEPYFWSVLYPQRSIKSKSLVTGGQFSTITHNFSKPVLSQMSSYNLNASGLPNPNQHNYLLNFVDDWSSSLLQSSGRVIYHLNDIFSSLSQLAIQASSFSMTVYPVSKGNNVHLAYSPKLNNEAKNVWRNNRIYENTQSKIISNPIYFYPIDECPECIKSQLFIEFEKPNSGGGISNTKFTLAYSPSFPLPINLPYQVVADSLGDYLEPIKKDTLFTDWFYIDSSATVEYLIKLNDTNHVNMKLQKLSDSSFVDLPAPFIAGSGFAQQVFHLVNGNNDEYRLAMINNDTLLNYVENLYFEAPYVSDTVYSKRNIEVKQNVINLNKNIQTTKLFSINCMPNPANEVLNIAVYSNQSTKVESVLIKIYNQQGMIVNEYQSSINSTLSIPVTQLTNGVYMIKASITTPDGFYNESSKVMILK